MTPLPDTTAKAFINKYATEVDGCFTLPDWKKPPITIAPPADKLQYMSFMGTAYEIWVGFALTSQGRFPRPIETWHLHSAFAQDAHSEHIRVLITSDRSKGIYELPVIRACLYIATLYTRTDPMSNTQLLAEYEIQRAFEDLRYQQELERLARGTDVKKLTALTRYHLSVRGGRRWVESIVWGGKRMLREIVVSPTFTRQGARGAISAQGDFILGRTLLEIKCAASIDYRSVVRQLLVYYALNKLSDKPAYINQLGAYYPRYGKLVLFEPQQLASQKQLTSLNVLKRYLGKKRRYPPSYDGQAAAQARR